METTETNFGKNSHVVDINSIDLSVVEKIIKADNLETKNQNDKTVEFLNFYNGMLRNIARTTAIEEQSTYNKENNLDGYISFDEKDIASLCVVAAQYAKAREFECVINADVLDLLKKIIRASCRFLIFRKIEARQYTGPEELRA